MVKVKNLILTFIMIFLTEYILRDILYVRSLYFIEWLQLNLRSLVDLAKLFSAFGNDKMFVIISLIFWNFFDIYKTLILITTMAVSSYLTGFLKMIYTDTRPFWVDVNIIAFSCEGGWGNPSGHALCSTAVYLTIWRLSFYSNKKEEYFNKNICLVLIIIFFILISLSRLLLGLHSINQILFGMFMGYSIYFFIFEIIKPDLNNPNELLKIISIDPSILLINNFVILLFTLIAYFSFSEINPNKQIYNRIIDQNNCEYLGNCKRFENDGIINCMAIHLIWVAIIGIKVEINQIFNKNIKNWVHYNFDKFFDKSHQELLIDDQENELIEYYNERWNKTNMKKSFIRLIISLLFLLINFVPYFYIDCNSNMIIVILFKIMMPCAISIFLLFSYFKQLLSKLKLAN